MIAFFVKTEALELTLILGFYFFSIVFSGIRAAYAAAISHEAPWERGSSADTLPDKPDRMLLLFLQRTCTLLSFISLARLYWNSILVTHTPLSVWVPVIFILFWLWSDAVVRFTCGRNFAFMIRRIDSFMRGFFFVTGPVSKVVFRIGSAMNLIAVEKTNKLREEAIVAEEDEEERVLLHGLATYSQVNARRSMQPRVNITAFDMELSFHELMDKINKSAYSRVPVYRGSLDHIEGILYVKDLLPYIQENEKFNWQKLLRKAYLIPESKRLDDLFQEFQKRRVHMAVVMDEYGIPSGLITLEDIIEEIFGDINDEYDEEQEIEYTQVSKDTFVFEGRVSIHDLTRILGLEPDYFWQVKADTESLGGMLLELFSHLPKVGERVSYRNLEFTAQSADKKMIKKVKITIKA